MAQRPSAPLLALLRKVAAERGLNTAALAKAVGLPRARLKHVLAGSQDLTVDELIRIAEALELSPKELTGMPEEGEDEDEAKEGGSAELRPLERTQRDDLTKVDPYGNHAEQTMRLGFALGVDMHLVLDTTALAGSGVPREVLARFTEQLPIRLDAAFHRHHDPRFLPEGVQVKMSFDALYTCTFPWKAFVQITIFPLPPEEETPDEQDEESEEVPRGHLRLVT